METKHTPGPWTAYKRPEPVGYAEWEVHYGTETECVAEVVHEEGNARLIAAAPELLEVIIAMMARARKTGATLFFDSDEMRAAYAAIDKATGNDRHAVNAIVAERAK